MTDLRTRESADVLFRNNMAEAANLAAELARDLLNYRHDTLPQYVENQEESILKLRSDAMEVLDMMENDQYDLKRIADIRAYSPKDVSKSRIGY
jgi:hypothetical protein